MQKDGEVKKEPYNSSTAKARSLKIEDFGNSEEVQEMAKPARQAKSRREAEDALENVISRNGTEKWSAIELKSKGGLSAFLQRSSIGKLEKSAHTVHAHRL